MEVEKSQRQVEMVSIEDLVPEGHAYRKFMTLLDFDDMGNRLKLKKNNPNEG